MGNRHVPDPKTPSVGFDSYVIHDTVQEYYSVARDEPPRDVAPEPVDKSASALAWDMTKAAGKRTAMFTANAAVKSSAVAYGALAPRVRALPVSRTTWVVGLIAVQTFLLGVLTALYFAGPSAPVVANLENEQPQAALAQAVLPVQEVIEQDVVAQAPAAEPEPVDASTLLEQAVAASFQPEVTRAASSDLISTSGPMSRSEEIPLTMRDILLGLSPVPTVGDLTQNEREARVLLSREKFQKLREGVLSGEYSVKAVKRKGQERLCLRLPNGNVTGAEAAILIEQAAARGEIDLPDQLATEDGSFDADTLIFNLVQTSLANDGTAEGAAAALEMSKRASAASLAKTKKVGGERIYVVERGDSLAYLSLQFYGRPNDYRKIFDANRKILSTPDRIQIGQRLIIPG